MPFLPKMQALDAANAVLDEFLNLCDQYGMYVIATSADFYMRDYVESAMNHPSVVMWGFQKYHFNYELAHRVKHECLRIDNTRPWYCEAVIASAANKRCCSQVFRCRRRS